MKSISKTIPLIGGWLVKINRMAQPRLDFITSSQYWEDRYKSGRSSGSGSYGRLAQFKAEVINDFVRRHEIRAVIEWGCGDGSQLMLSEYPRYLGLDVSPTAIEMCKKKFKAKNNYKFDLSDSYARDDLSPKFERFDLALSLDVIYHLIEDSVFHEYMKKLFNSSSRFVIIYAYNFDKTYDWPHEMGREFLVWVHEHAHQWRLLQKIENKFPYDPSDPSNTSQSHFYIFEFCES